MNIHEYQAKKVLSESGVNVAKGGVAYTAMEAETVAKDLGGPIWVVKSQIHAGGRGKGKFKEDVAGSGGGVRIVKSVAEVKKAANQMLGATLVTHQTGPAGKEVKRVYIENGCDIDRELYLSFLIDRSTSRVTIIACQEGGMDIEEVATKTPEKIKTIAIDPATGMKTFHAREIAFGLGLSGAQVKSAVKFLMAMYRAFVDMDASQIEINPMVVTKAGDVVALDAKMNFDDNAMFRRPEILKLRDLNEEDPAEIAASKHDLAYIKLNGSIGCMVNGAGLAMATMDIIKLYGKEPANFLDVGGGASKEKVAEAFKLILSDKNVKGILINIFGGIMRCDVLAQGVVEAAKEIKLSVPLVVRLAGTNYKEGKEILEKSKLRILSANDLNDAAKKIVEAIK